MQLEVSEILMLKVKQKQDSIVILFLIVKAVFGPDMCQIHYPSFHGCYSSIITSVVK